MSEHNVLLKSVGTADNVRVKSVGGKLEFTSCTDYSLAKALVPGEGEGECWVEPKDLVVALTKGGKLTIKGQRLTIGKKRVAEGESWRYGLDDTEKDQATLPVLLKTHVDTRTLLNVMPTSGAIRLLMHPGHSCTVEYSEDGAEVRSTISNYYDLDDPQNDIGDILISETVPEYEALRRIAGSGAPSVMELVVQIFTVQQMHILNERLQELSNADDQSGC